MTPPPPAEDGATDRLQELTDQLLVRDTDAHAEAITKLANQDDQRVLPHLLEVLVIDAIANDWERFGFPEVLRNRDPPRYLELPEVRWPGVRDALAELAEPDFDSDHAWVEWETWYSQQDIEPLEGFDDWNLRLYHSYLPPVGGLLDCEPRDFDLQAVRWGNCDRSFLAALNAPDFVPADAVTGDAVAANDGTSNPDATDSSEANATDPAEDDDSPRRHYEADDLVFSFEIADTPYAVPRWVLFPHELLNADLDGVPVSLTYCTLCNAPVLYDRRVGDDVLTFGSTGMLLAGNKIMYDEETESLWDQHAGRPIGGPHLARDPDRFLDQFAVTQTTWGEWRAEYPDTLALDVDTGYDYDYAHYDGNVGFFRHYWENEGVVQPGVRRADTELPEKASVYGVTEGTTVWVVPVDDVGPDDVVAGEAAGREVVALRDATGDVAVYEAPPGPVTRRSADGGEDGSAGALVDADGTEWTVMRSELRTTDGETRDRIPGRHGLWFAFRTHYDDAQVLGS